jgi:enterochelin esterase-like enzyme
MLLVFGIQSKQINYQSLRPTRYILVMYGLQENMVLGANRKFARILKEKGYHYKFVEFNG